MMQDKAGLLIPFLQAEEYEELSISQQGNTAADPQAGSNDQANTLGPSKETVRSTEYDLAKRWISSRHCMASQAHLSQKLLGSLIALKDWLQKATIGKTVKGFNPCSPDNRDE